MGYWVHAGVQHHLQSKSRKHPKTIHNSDQNTAIQSHSSGAGGHQEYVCNNTRLTITSGSFGRAESLQRRSTDLGEQIQMPAYWYETLSLNSIYFEQRRLLFPVMESWRLSNVWLMKSRKFLSLPDRYFHLFRISFFRCNT